MDNLAPRSDPPPDRKNRAPVSIAHRGRFRAILLAVLMHVALFGFLMVGVRWNTQKPVAVQAELWTPAPSVAKPEPKPEPKPELKPEPKPEAKPEPVVEPEPEPKPPEPPPPAKPEELVKPDIALEKEREEKERKQRELEAQRKRELEDKKKRDDELRKAEEKKAELARSKAEELERKQAAEERKREQAAKDAEEKKQADAKAKKEAELKKLADAKAKKDAADDEKRREDYLKRLVDSAGKPSDSAKTASNQTGQAVGASAGGASGGSDGGYAAKVASMLRSNTTYQVPGDLSGNPKAVFLVALAPDCSIVSVKLRKSSGVPTWDDAAQRGIERSDPFPKPRSGNCEREMEIARGPRELQQ